VRGAVPHTTLSPEAWSAVAAIVGSISAALSAVAISRTNATKRDVGETSRRVTAAGNAAAEARELARPTGNGYADESRAAWARIEDLQAEHTDAIRDLSRRHVRTNTWLVKHLSDHARNDIQHDRDREEEEGP